eukprot:GHVT01032018.1.p1 GENE.GHVT01032018.1~~GHVT01032018.1.p1  ORF type:complete len:132 (+),score=2.71 GHVT01032018.1:87-482(+)
MAAPEPKMIPNARWIFIKETRNGSVTEIEYCKGNVALVAFLRELIVLKEEKMNGTIRTFVGYELLYILNLLISKGWKFVSDSGGRLSWLDKDSTQIMSEEELSRQCELEKKLQLLFWIFGFLLNIVFEKYY